MDPTAPKDNNTPPLNPPQGSANPSNPQDGLSFALQTPNVKNQPSPIPSPIEPGQFVVAQDESQMFKEPPSPAQMESIPSSPQLPSQPDQNIGSIPLSTLSTEQPQPFVAPPPETPPQATPHISLAGPTASNEGLPPSDFVGAPASSPFAPPLAAENSETSPTTPTEIPPQSSSPAIEGASQMKKIRTFAIIGGAVILIGTLLAGLWFFVLSKNIGSQQNKTKVQDAQVIDEPPPLPKRSSSGFAEFPQLATGSAQTATPSASVKVSPTPTPRL